MKATASQRNESAYLRRDQAAKYLGVSERHLAALVQRRVIPVIRLGRRCCLFDTSRIREALARYEERELGAGE